MAAGDLPLPEQCRIVTEEAWKPSQLLECVHNSFDVLPRALQDLCKAVLVSINQ